MVKLSDKKNIPAILLTRITGTQQKLKKNISITLPYIFRFNFKNYFYKTI